MPNPNPLDFIRWEQVAALAIIVAAALIGYWLKEIRKTAVETRDLALRNSEMAQKNQELAQENQQSTSKISKTLTETNSGSHVKDQLNRLEVKISKIAKWNEENKDFFQYMRRNFRHPEYFDELENSLSEIRTHLSRMDRPGQQTNRGGLLRQSRIDRSRRKREEQ